jgi:hypothetical protein
MNKGTLIAGQWFTLTVAAIEQNADSFNKSSGGTSHCHYFTLKDEEGGEYDCQICNDFIEQNYCKVGDVVRVKVKIFAKGRHTLESITVAVAANSTGAQQPAPASTGKSSPVSNPNVAGKASSIALSLAVTYHQNRPAAGTSEPSDSIITMANKFFKFLTEKEVA